MRHRIVPNKRWAIVAAAVLGSAAAAQAAAEPTIAELLERMKAYEDRIQQLEDRVARADARTAAAESALMAREVAQPAAPVPEPVAAAAPAEPPALSAQDPPKLATMPVTPEQPRHYRDRSAIPHGEGGPEFPNAWPIPGTDSWVSIGGYVKGDLIQDFDSIDNDHVFQTSAIAVEGTADDDLGGRTKLNARETRLSFDFHKPLPTGPMRAFIEGDFYGSGNDLRLRHAYGQLGGLLVGQTWSTFADLPTHPGTLDFEGPDASVMRRAAQFRYTQALGEGWSVALALEDPGTSIANQPGFAGADRSNVPDLPAFLRYQSPAGSAQLAGIVRQIRFDGQSGAGDESATGYGFALSFAAKPYRDDVLSGQFIYGDGIADYIQGVNGTALDGALAADGTLETVAIAAGMLAYTHHWSSSLRSVFSYSLIDVGSESILAPDAIGRLQDVHANLIWSPVKGVDLGSEIIWGKRSNQDGVDGDATRLQFSAKYYLD